MCMMLIQCFGCGNLGMRRAARTGEILISWDAPLALVVKCVAISLDELGFAQIAQIHVPLDAQLALVVECVATALDELAFARGAAKITQIHVPLDAQLALVVECVATALDELASARGAAQIAHFLLLLPFFLLFFTPPKTEIEKRDASRFRCSHTFGF